MQKIRELYKRPASQGFTLIEMAIVLVVIGLILGMVFKGRQLIASAKVKNANAGYNKVIAGMNIFYDRYGFYPGDGCSDYNEGDPMTCDEDKNGLVETTSNNDDTAAFFDLMVAKDILTKADTESALGDAWNATGNSNSTWIYVESADARIVCDLDRVADDGDSDDGDIRSGSDMTSWGGENDYDNDTDCWDETGTTGVQLKILP